MSELRRHSPRILRATLVSATCIALSGCSSNSVAPEPVQRSVPASGDSSVGAPPSPLPSVPVQEPNQIECTSLGIVLDELPVLWNKFVDEGGIGYRLPDSIVASGTALGLSEYTQFLDQTLSDSFSISVYWHPESSQVSEIAVFGPVRDTRTSIALTWTAAAMISSVTGKSPAETERFLVDVLMAGMASVAPEGLVSEVVEDENLEFRFTFASGFADWSVAGYRACPSQEFAREPPDRVAVQPLAPRVVMTELQIRTVLFPAAFKSSQEAMRKALTNLSFVERVTLYTYDKDKGQVVLALKPTNQLYRQADDDAFEVMRVLAAKYYSGAHNAWLFDSPDWAPSIHLQMNPPNMYMCDGQTMRLLGASQLSRAQWEDACKYSLDDLLTGKRR